MPTHVTVDLCANSMQTSSAHIVICYSGCKGITIARLAKKEEHDAQETVSFQGLDTKGSRLAMNVLYQPPFAGYI
eukprot:scaffold5285_cov19-Tisochrysis_lutea.AAC.2